MVGEVSASATRSVLHGDRSFIKDTHDAITGKNGASVALKALLPVLGDCLKAINDGTGETVHATMVQRAAHAGAAVLQGKEKDRASLTRSAHSHQHGAILSARVFAAAAGASLVVAGKKSENAHDFGALVGECFTATIEELVSAFKPAKKDKVETVKADAAPDAGTAETADDGAPVAPRADGPTTVQGFAQAVRAVRHARAQTVKARQERDTARAEVIRLLALIEGMQQPKPKAEKKARTLKVA